MPDHSADSNRTIDDLDSNSGYKKIKWYVIWWCNLFCCNLNFDSKITIILDPGPPVFQTSQTNWTSNKNVASLGSKLSLIPLQNLSNGKGLGERDPEREKRKITGRPPHITQSRARVMWVMGFYLGGTKLARFYHQNKHLCRTFWYILWKLT